MLDLNEIRDDIDKIDRQLVELFEERMKLTTEVAEYKIETGKKVLDPVREKAKLEAVRKLVKNPDNVHAIDDLFSQIMANSRKNQYMLLEKMGQTLREPYEAIDEIDKTIDHLQKTKEALLSSDKTMLHFKVQEKPTSLNEIFALNRYYNSIDTHNGTPQITYPNLVKFINGLGNKEYVTSLYRAFFRQTNICAYLYPVSNVPTENSVYLLKQNIAGEPYGSPYNEKDESDPSKLKLLSFKGYNRLTDVSECFEYCDINFMNKNLFNDINLKDGKTIKIENMFDCRNLQYIHKDTFAPISNKYRVFLFN